MDLMDRMDVEKIDLMDVERRILRPLFFVCEATTLTLYLVGPSMWRVIEYRIWSWIFVLSTFGLAIVGLLLRRTDRGLALIAFITFASIIALSFIDQRYVFGRG